MINASGNRLTMEIARQSRLAQQIAETQIDISSGRRIQSASDDPVAAARVSQIRRAQANDEVWSSNISLGLSLAGQADGVVATLSDRLARVQELITAGASETLSPADRATYALELDGIAEEIDSYIATDSSLGESLFADGSAREMRFSENAVFAAVPSREDVFGTGLNTLGQIIRDAAGAVSSGNLTAIGNSQDVIQDAVARTADVASEIGVRAARMERLLEGLEQRKIDFAAERSSLEDTNLSEAIARLNAQTITLEAAQAAFARINRRTLFDILQ